MAKVKQISVETSFTKNLGNYQSIKISAGAVLDLDENDSVREQYQKAFDLVSFEMNEKLEMFPVTKGGR